MLDKIKEWDPKLGQIISWFLFLVTISSFHYCVGYYTPFGIAIGNFFSPSDYCFNKLTSVVGQNVVVFIVLLVAAILCDALRKWHPSFLNEGTFTAARLLLLILAAMGLAMFYLYEGHEAGVGAKMQPHSVIRLTSQDTPLNAVIIGASSNYLYLLEVSDSHTIVIPLSYVMRIETPQTFVVAARGRDARGMTDTGPTRSTNE